MAGVPVNKQNRRAAIIALRKAQIAKEMMQAFRRASINPKKM